MATSHRPEGRDKFDMTASAEIGWQFPHPGHMWGVIGCIAVLLGLVFFLTGGQPSH